MNGKPVSQRGKCICPYGDMDSRFIFSLALTFRFSFSLSLGFRGHDQFAEVVSVVVSVVVGVVDMVMGFGVVNVMGLEVVRFVLMIFVMMIMMSNGRREGK